MAERDRGVERAEVEALLETRRELGREYDAELVDSFADRVEAAIERRVSAEVERRGAGGRAQSSAGSRQLTLGIVSAFVGIPVSGIAMGSPDNETVGLLGLLVSWGGLVGINIAHALQNRPRR